MSSPQGCVICAKEVTQQNGKAALLRPLHPPQLSYLPYLRAGLHPLG